MDAEPRTSHQSTPAELQARIAAEREGNPFLLLRDGDGAQRILPLEDGVERVTIGRHADNDVPLPWDSMASRVHAVLEPVAGAWTVSDDGLSRNGTWIGQDRVTGRRRLHPDDVLRIGNTNVAFRDPRAASESGSTQMGEDIQTTIELTRAQRRVLTALCRPMTGEFGHPATNQEIADELSYSVDAVKTHLRTLFRKFAIGDLPQNQKRQQLAERARRFGIITNRDLEGEHPR